MTAVRPGGGPPIHVEPGGRVAAHWRAAPPDDPGDAPAADAADDPRTSPAVAARAGLRRAVTDLVDATGVEVRAAVVRGPDGPSRTGSSREALADAPPDAYVRVTVSHPAADATGIDLSVDPRADGPVVGCAGATVPAAVLARVYAATTGVALDDAARAAYRRAVDGRGR